MEEIKGRFNSVKKAERGSPFSKTHRAGKRTYFFDVKVTKNKEKYLTITESKKKYDKEGKHYYEKHKIFVYEEEIANLATILHEVADTISVKPPSFKMHTGAMEIDSNFPNDETKQYTDVEFEDLEKYPVTEKG